MVLHDNQQPAKVFGSGRRTGGVLAGHFRHWFIRPDRRIKSKLFLLQAWANDGPGVTCCPIKVWWALTVTSTYVSSCSYQTWHEHIVVGLTHCFLFLYVARNCLPCCQNFSKRVKLFLPKSQLQHFSCQLALYSDHWWIFQQLYKLHVSIAHDCPPVVKMGYVWKLFSQKWQMQTVNWLFISLFYHPLADLGCCQSLIIYEGMISGNLSFVTKIKTDRASEH